MDSALDLGRVAVTMLVIVVACYAYAMAIFGRRARTPQGIVEDPPFFVVLVPCLDEAAVIGRTMASLAALRGRFHVLVVDDASDDDSVEVIRRSSPRLVTVLERRDPDARVGKGAALNAGYRAALGWGVDRLYGPDRVIVTVFDADSSIPADFLERVAPYFTEPEVVGVQSAVRMSNAGRGWLTFWQDLEFVVWGRVFARAKDRLGSATLGGNGQCVRLSALMALVDAPWRPSLTEDLDLSLRLVLQGGRIRFCGETFVAEEAVPDLRRLVRQRARWVQGHFVAWEHIPAILRSTAPRRVRFDLLAFLLLPASLVPLALATVDGWLTLLSGLGSWSIEAMLAWYLLAFASTPLTMWALTRDRVADTPRAIIHAHLFLAYAAVWMTAAAGAVASIIRGDRAWAKTSRTPMSGLAAQTEAAPGASPVPRGPSPSAGQARRSPRWRQQRITLGAATAVALIAVSSLILVSAAAFTSSTYEEVTGRHVVDLGVQRGPAPTAADSTIRR